MRWLLSLCVLFAGILRADVIFDDVDDVISCGSAAALDNINTFTYAAWIYPTAVTGGYVTVAIKQGTGYKHFSIENSVVLLSVARATSPLAFISSTTISANAWHHVATTCDGSDTAHIYLDGVEVAYSLSQAGSGAYTTEADGNFYIGNIVGSTGSFAGTIADVRVYNRVLSAAEVASLGSAKLKYDSNTSGLIAYWPLDDQPDGTSGDGDTYLDRAGANNGTGADGANNTGLTNRASAAMSYP